MKSILRLSVSILFVTLGVSGFCQVLSPSQVHSVSPSVWVLKGDGEVFVLPPPTTFSIFLPGGVTMEMVKIPAGSFMMASPDNEQDRWSDEGPQHQVTIGYDFYLGKYEVTKAQWTAVMGTTPWSGYSYVLNDPNSPAVSISWNDCQAFVHALNHLGQGTFRLPSEAEWEYACRAGTTTRFYWGDDPSYTQIGSYAWYWGNCSSEQYAHVVGLKLPNDWGLYDMSGNVWEWCQDYWYGNYSGAPANGSAWESPTSSGRVLRGGCWCCIDYRCRSASRYWDFPGSGYYDSGVRIVRTQ